MIYRIHVFVAGLTVLLIAAACASPPSLVKPGAKVGDLVVTQGAFNRATPPIWAFCESANPEIPSGASPGRPGVYTAACSVPAIPNLDVGPGWCAAEKPLLDANWQALTWELYLDGHQLDLPAFGTFEAAYFERVQTLSGAEVHPLCRTWAVLLAKPTPSVHTLRVVYRLSQDVADGFLTYPAGTYDKTLTVTFTPERPATLPRYWR